MAYDSSTKLNSSSWSERHGGMDKKREFFCAVKVKELGWLSIGGLGHRQKGTVVEDSLEYTQIGQR